MPRLEPGGPGLAVTPDHAWVAVAHGGSLSLIDTATRETRAKIDLPAGQTELYASAQRLFAFVRLESSTGCYTFSIPELELITSMELIGHAVPLAGVQDRVLVVGLLGETPRILSLAGKNLTADPIPLREPVQFAAEAPEEGLLVSARDQLECWDPLRRRALFRLHLPVTQPKLGGFASRRRQLWVVSSSAAGPLEVYRFSDGRLQARAELGKRILAVDGHPDSPRLVVAARADGEAVELVQFDLSLDERNPIKDAGVPASFCVVDGRNPVLVVGRADGSIDYVTLPRATPLDEPARHGVPKRAPEPTLQGSALADRLAGWRNRLATDKPEAEAARARLADPPRRREEPKSVLPVPVREPRRRTEPPAVAEAQPPASFGGGWRSALCAWAQTALERPGHGAPPADDQTLALLIARLDLTPGAARGLALLYGQWLLGDGERGVALAVLAQAMATDDEDGWTEALLGGGLGHARICRIVGGRVRLRALTGRFLDGRAPLVRLVQPPSDVTPMRITASQRVPSRGGELSVEDASSLAQKLGRIIAVVPAGTRARVEPAVTEARLHDALPLLLSTLEGDSWADLAAEQVLVVATDDDAPASLRDLPLLE